MELIENDYWWKTLILDCPDVTHKITAHVKATQPQGYVQQMSVDDIQIRDGKADIPILYPLVDEGRYDQPIGTWEGAWIMGEYRFETELYAAGKRFVKETITLDPHTFFPSDRMVISVDARTQFIECAPRQALYLNEDVVHFTVRIHRCRVTKCRVEIDVTLREETETLAGPWQFSLTNFPQEGTFSTDDWGTGEYWIRIRPIVDGVPVGPYCVRKFWKEDSPEPEPPEFIELRGYPEVMVDDYSFSEVKDIQFVPDTLEKRPDTPLVSQTEPHENEMIGIESLNWNAEQRRYECIYSNGGGRVEREQTQEERAHLKMLLISEDGENWEKPKLGLVEYDGSSDNNILSDNRHNPSAAEKESTHDIEYAQFRFYDAERDGPVNSDNVFLASGKRHFPFACESLKRKSANRDEFRPRSGEFWPFEKRGDLYLVLTKVPVLYLGVGMGLMHTSESIRCHVEATISLQGEEKKRLLFYFRPASPAYPPHGASWDNMHLCLRCLAVLWTDDGLNYHRNFVIGSDAYDQIGTQFYAMGMLQKLGTSGDAPGRPVLDKLLSKINQAFPKRNVYLGSVLVHWGIEQTQAPELVWTRDFLHFKRFKAHRRSLIEPSRGGTYNCGMIRDKYKYSEFNGEWWYHYTAINTRHNGYGVMARHCDIESLKNVFPNHADAPYFTTWEGYFVDGKQTKYLPAVARCKPFRLAHAEPVDLSGELTTRLIKVDGDELRLNAATERGGCIRVELTDEKGNHLLETAFTFEGDAVDALVAELTPWMDELIRISFQLDRARLYAFSIVKKRS